MDLSQDQWRDIFCQCPIGLAIFSKEGSLLHINDAMVNILGYSHAEVEGKMMVSDITHPADIKGDLEMIAQLRDNKIDHYEVVKRFLTKSGNTVWVRLVVHGIYEEKKLQNMMKFVIPIIHGDRVKAMTSDEELSIRSKSSINEFIKKEWKWVLTTAAAATVAIFSFFHKYTNMTEQVEHLEKTLQQLSENQQIAIQAIEEIRNK